MRFKIVSFKPRAAIVVSLKFSLREESPNPMADQCHMRGCTNTSYDDCAVCKQPTCRPHGRPVGDHFVCRDCADKAK